MRARTALPIALLVAAGAAIPATTAVAGTDDDDVDDIDDDLESGDDYSVVGALSELPITALDAQGYLLLTGDIDAAGERAGLADPGDDDDAALSRLFALTGGPRESEDAEFAPVALVLPGWMMDAVGSSAELRETVGWSVADIEAFASAETPPASFHVISGDFDDDDPFPASLPEVADDVVTVGEGDDLQANLQEQSPLSRLGVPQRMTADDDRIAFGPVLADVLAWQDDDDDDDDVRSVVTEDPRVLAVARALDAADVVSAVVAPTVGADPTLILGSSPDPAQMAALEEQLAATAGLALDVVGLGWSTDDDGAALITVAYHLMDDGAADATVTALTELYETSTSVRTGAPLTELVTLDRVEAGDGVVVATLRPAEGRSPLVIHQMLMTRELPFAVAP